jgi:hypothetical protein
MQNIPADMMKLTASFRRFAKAHKIILTETFLKTAMVKRLTFLLSVSFLLALISGFPNLDGHPEGGVGSQGA